MPTFVVATRGTSLKEMQNTTAYLIEAEDLGHAKALAMADQCEGQASEDVDGLIRELLASYGDEWFVQLLNPDCTAGYVLKNRRK